ncbi:5-dehydro-2-deoxygluconokinase [Arthrobacter crystallopoietes]|uniref:5-dehydro-2-deoxygluconokinase n=1 Tax=Crystallibacter crystallopoietes TaxID=37928 RepID=A0A1H0ZHN0_9MICC|nr:5-dehydro-2-deoxygluconokinase [Arthrobacter crystallopoietes]AUI51978.1 5-dehydro-2-deoxygluconokinase [Arthrobacter crystallopoietes]SDQ26839.1 5-dehydro-2-deoxygluconokinase [Arthrobacter crystallopoietes]
MAHDLLTMGRISVDIYPNDIGVGLADVSSFGKYLGGSPSNVAVAAARHGRRSAIITRTGEDPFGEYLHRELHKFGVDDSFITAVPGLQTPATFCAIMPPEDFPLYFYGRFPTAPDLQIAASELDLSAIREAGIFWSTVTGLCQEPSRSAHLAAHEARRRENLQAGQYTVLDLDYRPMFWGSEEEAREQVAKILPHVTVAIGNDKECAVAVGEGTPDEQADRLLEAGVEIAVVKLGPEGVMAKTRNERVVSAPVPVETVNGLGAGDAFGGAFCHGLLSGWPLGLVLDYANASGALVASRLSCADAMPTPHEVNSLLAERGRNVPAPVEAVR